MSEKRSTTMNLGPYEPNKIYSGHCLELLKKIPDGVISSVITSPPYFNLRDYGLKPVEWPEVSFSPMAGLPEIVIPSQECSLGLEADIWSYVGHLVLIFRQVKRVLHTSGSMFLNLGDSYANDSKWGGKSGGKNYTSAGGGYQGQRQKRDTGLKSKDLMLIPHRVALALQADSWCLRSDMPWVKRNCLNAATVVYARTQKGDMPTTIKDLVRLRPETVKLWNGERWTQVIGFYENRQPDQPLEIELRNGQKIGCTSNHVWPTQRGNVCAGNLLVGDVVQSCRLPEPDCPNFPAGLPDKEIGWIVGLYLAEGFRNGDNNGLGFAGHIKEVERLARLATLAKAYDGTCRVHHTVGNNAPIHLYSRVIRGIIDTYISGEGAKSKHLSNACWRRSDEFLQAVLDGYLEGDGHYDIPNNRWRLGFTNNDSLAADLRCLTARLGVSLRLKRGKSSIYDPVTKTAKYFVGWRGQIRFDHKDRSTNRGGFKLKEDGEIVAIRSRKASRFWDIAVADDPHLFALASGILSHNSMPSSQQDRPTVAKEYWFLLSKSERYYFDLEAIKLPTAESSRGRLAQDVKGQRGSDRANGGAKTNGPMKAVGDPDLRARRDSDWFFDSLRAILDDNAQMLLASEEGDPLALTVNPTGYKGAHFAVFPPALVTPLVLASTSERGCCPECGAPWRRVVEKVKGDNASYNGSSFQKGKSKEELWITL